MSQPVPYIVYRADTGDIVKTGQCPDYMVGVMPRQGESVMIGHASDIEHKVYRDPEGRKSLIPLTAEERAAKCPPAGPPHLDLTVDDLLLALRGKGVDITRGEVETIALSRRAAPEKKPTVARNPS